MPLSSRNRGGLNGIRFRTLESGINFKDHGIYCNTNFNKSQLILTFMTIITVSLNQRSILVSSSELNNIYINFTFVSYVKFPKVHCGHDRVHFSLAFSSNHFCLVSHIELPQMRSDQAQVGLHILSGALSVLKYPHHSPRFFTVSLNSNITFISLHFKSIAESLYHNHHHHAPSTPYPIQFTRLFVSLSVLWSATMFNIHCRSGSKNIQ